MLTAAVGIFVVLIAIALWFYRTASTEGEQKLVPAAKTKPLAPRPFIPVVRPPTKNISRTVTTMKPGCPEDRDIVREATPSRTSTVISNRPLPALRLEASVVAVQAQPMLVVKAHGIFPRPEGWGLVFELNFVLPHNPTAKVKRRDPRGRDPVSMCCRIPSQAEAFRQEWFELLNVPVDEFFFARAGAQEVRLDCSAVLTDAPEAVSVTMQTGAVLCTSSVIVRLSPDGLGYEDLEEWMSMRKSALCIIAGCVSASSPECEAHRDVILKWISSECASQALPSASRTSYEISLLGRLGSCQFDVMPSTVSCEALASLLGSAEPLRNSLHALFDSLAAATVASLEPLNRFEQACRLLKISVPKSCDLVRQRIIAGLVVASPLPVTIAARSVQPLPTAIPSPAQIASTEVIGLPFTVSLKLVGTVESAKGLRVYVSGDLPAAASSDVQITISITDKDDDAKRAFLSLPDDIDVVGQVLLPKTIFSRSQYDPRAPRQVAEILFDDCAYPRSGERTLRVACAAYSVGQDSALSHLCSAETAGTVKIPGVGYVLQQKRRRVQRGLVLDLVLATVSFSGPVSLPQKSVVKDWIAAEASKINDKNEVQLTINHLTKVLLKASTVTHAELIALALELAGRRKPQLSKEAVQLAERLVAAKPGTAIVTEPYLVKIRQELGLSAKKGSASCTPAFRLDKPKVPKGKSPGLSPAISSPAVRTAIALNRKLGRTVVGWSAMRPEAKVAHLRQELLLSSSRMGSKQGLSERNKLQQLINDLAELVVLIRRGQA